MIYYKVKKQFVAHGKKDIYEFVQDELITQKEFAIICNICGFTPFKLLNYHSNFETIEISMNNVYKFFGCRFEK